MQIMELKKKNAYDILVLTTLQDEPYLMDGETCLSAGITSPCDFSDEAFYNVLDASDARRAFRSAVSFLERSSRTQKELELNLKKKGFDEKAISTTVEKALNYRLIDDQEYAQRFVRDRLERKGVGEQAIRYEMLMKGIDRALIDEALGALDEDAQLNRARQHLPALRRKYAAQPAREARAKASMFLKRKGFDWDTISSVLSDWGEDED